MSSNEIDSAVQTYVYIDLGVASDDAMNAHGLTLL